MICTLLYTVCFKILSSGDKIQIVIFSIVYCSYLRFGESFVDPVLYSGFVPIWIWGTRKYTGPDQEEPSFDSSVGSWLIKQA